MTIPHVCSMCSDPALCLHNYAPIDQQKETAISIPYGWLVFPAYLDLCEYVRAVSISGHEAVYWDFHEWRDDAAEVMGAIMGTLVSGCDFVITHTPETPQ